MAITESQARYRSSPKYRESLKKYQQKNREKIREAGRRYRVNRPDAVKASGKASAQKIRQNAPHKLLFYAAKRRAKIAGLPFEIEIDDVVIPDRCPVFGVSFVRGDRRWAASIDKIDPSLGYVKGNIQVISMLANTMKNEATPEQLRRFASWSLTLWTDYDHVRPH